MKYFWHEMMNYSADSAKYIFQELQFIARTVNSSMDDVVKFLEESEIQQLTKAQMTIFLDLYMDLHNHTRMQCNRGHTPAEIADMEPYQKNEVKSISLGPNIRNQLKDGTLSFEELLNGILTMELPNEDIRKDMLAQLEEIRKEMTSESSAPAKKPKVGRNDPCPCESGKKYKKCCGK